MSKVSTLQEHYDGNYYLCAICLCGHSSELDLGHLLTLLGPDFDVVDNRAWLLSRLKCQACGAHASRLQASWNGVPDMS